jgi:hypothetical protein
MGSKSLGTLEALKLKQDGKNTDVQEYGNTGIQEYKNTDVQEYRNTGIQKEERIKRTYKITNSTVKKLEELRVYLYPVGTELSDIVDEAICMLYESKKQG